jgi:hypothetical protein
VSGDIEAKLAFIDRSQEAMCQTVLRIDRVVTRLEAKLDELLALLRTDGEAVPETPDGLSPSSDYLGPKGNYSGPASLMVPDDYAALWNSWRTQQATPINDPNGGRR